MADLPLAEPRALLLTDVVDSTQWTERLGDAGMAELNAAHDRVARDLLRAWRGREIDKTDGMLMLFDDVADAVGCALAYHRALAALPVPLRARAGVHVGAVTLRANPADDVLRGAKPLEVEGLAKPTAARVMSLAVGGQTLLSAEARAALGDGAWRVQAHGHWRVKGVAEPIELYEVGDDGAPFVPPPDSAKVYRVVRRGELWLPRREVRHSLPAERDVFVGRREALADLARRFDAGARLVSVLGIGGTGKTRLAVRFGWTWLGDYPGGVWFCDLAQAQEEDGLVHAVARGLDVPLGLADPVTQLGHAIAGRGDCLIVLDNFEQIARHAADTLGLWLDRAAQAKFLVTSREVLGLPGEEALALPPLPLAEAESLFLRRAASAGRDFAPDAAARTAIARLVGLLDGLPLAIELAAARVRVLAPAALLERMDQRFRLLVASGGRRDRQSTLRAAFDWSWDLLAEPEKVALAQLSVFVGGFTLEAAEAVLDLSACSSACDEAPWPVDLVQSLVDKSLAQRTDDRRFDLLVSVQEYAAEHLCTPGRCAGSGPDALLAAHRRHGGYFAALAGGRDVRSLAADLGNLVAACRRAAESGAVEPAIATLEGAWAVLEQRGPFATGIDLAAPVLGLGTLSVGQRARAGLVAGRAASAAGRLGSARQQLQATLDDARVAGDARLEARVLVELGDIEGDEARFDAARQHHEEALRIARAIGAPALEGLALNGLGTLCSYVGDLRQARAHCEAALQAAGRGDDRRHQGALFGNLGGLCFDEGRLEDAERHMRAGLAAARQTGDRMLEGKALCNLGALHLARGDLAAALEESGAALALARAMGYRRLEAIVSCNLGLVAFRRADAATAERHHLQALALARELSDPRSEGLFLAYLAQAQAALQRCDAARASLDAGERLLAGVADRIGLGLVACHRAEVEFLAGDVTTALAAHAQAQGIAAEVGAGAGSELGLALARAAALLGRTSAGGTEPASIAGA